MPNTDYELANTTWMCEYHLVFTPKYRRKVICNQLRLIYEDLLGEETKNQEKQLPEKQADAFSGQPKRQEQGGWSKAEADVFRCWPGIRGLFPLSEPLDLRMGAIPAP